MTETPPDEPAFTPLPAEDAPGEPWSRWWGAHLRELRWQAELARLLVDPIWRGEGVDHGDGMPVLAMPGFLAGDASLAPMRSWLKRIGYEPKRSGISVNVNCSDILAERLSRRLVRLAERSGRKVALIGHSRGGHFAKSLSIRHPDLVSCAISIGAGLDTPFAISLPTQVAVRAVRGVHAQTSDRTARRGCMTTSCSCRFTRDYTSPFPPEVPLTSIYSQGDGVVWWPACLVDYANCVEVSGSHVGLASNRRVYAVVAEALAAASAASAAPVNNRR